MSVSDNEGEAVEVAVLEGREKGLPVGVGFAEASNGAFSVRTDSDEHIAIQEKSSLADLSYLEFKMI